MIDHRYTLVLLVLALLASCSRPPTAEPQVVPAPAVQPAPAEPAAAQVAPEAPADAVAAVAEAPQSTMEARVLRDAFTQCVTAAGGADVAMQDCIGSEYEYQDGRLNAIYAELKRTLTETDMTRLRDAQRQWLRERDSKCVWDAKTEGSAQRLQANYCRMEATAKRVAELEAMQ